MTRKAIEPKNANLDVSRNFGLPYACGIEADGLVFLSGMTAIDRATGERKHGTMASETADTLANIAEVLEDAGSSMASAVKINVFLHSLLEMDSFNRSYLSFFPEAPPARNVSGVVLNDGMKVKIECIALARGEDGPRRERSTIEPKNPFLNNSKRSNRPHSPGVRAGNLLFISGMVPLDPATGESKLGSTAEQTRTVLTNMAHLLESGGSSLDQTVKLNVSLANMLECDTFYRTMSKFFPRALPACTVVGMQLSNGHGVEIECIATV